VESVDDLVGHRGQEDQAGILDLPDGERERRDGDKDSLVDGGRE